jgi:hypothetical protein
MKLQRYLDDSLGGTHHSKLTFFDKEANQLHDGVLTINSSFSLLRKDDDEGDQLWLMSR